MIEYIHFHWYTRAFFDVFFDLWCWFFFLSSFFNSTVVSCLYENEHNKYVDLFFAPHLYTLKFFTSSIFSVHRACVIFSVHIIVTMLCTYLIEVIQYEECNRCMVKRIWVETQESDVKLILLILKDVKRMPLGNFDSDTK